MYRFIFSLILFACCLTVGFIFSVNAPASHLPRLSQKDLNTMVGVQTCCERYYVVKPTCGQTPTLCGTFPVNDCERASTIWKASCADENTTEIKTNSTTKMLAWGTISSNCGTRNQGYCKILNPKGNPSICIEGSPFPDSVSCGAKELMDKCPKSGTTRPS